jgi:RNA polymerase sigma factor (sigma-70 family)
MSPLESEKIGKVYKSERKRLLGYIRNRIPDTVEAEDILQDVFYQLTIGFRDIRRIENLTAWIYKVADNRITDLFRKKKYIHISYSENSSDDEEGPLTLEEILPSLGSTPGDEEIKELIWETIEETLAELPEEQSSVFIDNEFEDMSTGSDPGAAGKKRVQLLNRYDKESGSVRIFIILHSGNNS